MSGWQQPGAGEAGGPGRASGWAAPPDPLGPGQLVRRGWRLYRSVPRPFLAVALGAAALQALTILPSIGPTVGFFEAFAQVMGDWWTRIMADPQAYTSAEQATLQAELDARLAEFMTAWQGMAPLAAVGGGVATAASLAGTCALTALALSVAAGRPVPVAFALRLVAARRGLVIPIAAIALGWAAVNGLGIAVQSSADIQAWAGQPGSPRSILIGSLLGVAALVLLVAIVVLAVRWALYVPAVLVEALGVGPGLARAARLSQGIRIRLGLAMAGILLVQTFALGLIAWLLAVPAWFVTGSIGAGVVAYLVMSVAGGALLAPWLPAVLAVAYRERTLPAGSAMAGPGDATAGPGDATPS